MAYEYSMVNNKSYKQCEAVANCIISDITSTYKIDKKNIRYHHIVNYLNSNYSPSDIFCFSKKPTLISKDYPEINRFNNLLTSVGLDMRCSDILYEKDSFVKTVDGLTVFTDEEPIIFLNASSVQYYPHVIFTIIHESVHVYEAHDNPDYMKAAALIGKSKLSGTEYPEELQPIEDRTNVIASLLYIPSCSLSENILKQSFSELCFTYTTSWAAMHNRLFNYFFYERNWSEYAAKNAVFAFRNCDLSQITEVREKLIKQSTSGIVYFPF